MELWIYDRDDRKMVAAILIDNGYKVEAIGQDGMLGQLVGLKVEREDSK